MTNAGLALIAAVSMTSFSAKAVETALTGSSNTPAATVAASSKYFGQREHAECTEMTTREADDGAHWTMTSFGGADINSDFSILQKNQLDRVHFGSGEQTITFDFKGRNVVPQSMRTTDNNLGFETNNLITSSAIVGKMIVFQDYGKTMFRDAHDLSHWRVKMAILYSPKGSPSLNVPCEYAPGPIDFAALDEDKCLWIDNNSRSSTGKEYCW